MDVGHDAALRWRLREKQAPIRLIIDKEVGWRLRGTQLLLDMEAAEVRAAHAMWIRSIHVRCEDALTLAMRFRIEVPDKDTGAPFDGEQTVRWSWRDVEAPFSYILHRALYDIVVHELEEGLFIRGEQVHHPHSGGR